LTGISRSTAILGGVLCSPQPSHPAKHPGFNFDRTRPCQPQTKIIDRNVDATACNRPAAALEPTLMRVIETPTAGPWCWTCRYDLAALPEAGCCPRCGGRYDVRCNRVLRHGRWAQEMIGSSWDGRFKSRRERLLFHLRAWSIIVTVLGSSGIVITFAVLGIRALFA